MTGSMVDSDVWIRRYHPPASGGPERIPLVCFPHAGGSAGYFYGLSRRLSPAVEVLAVQYPGRQDRLAEAPVEDVRELAARIVAALEPWAGRRPAYFGHSMGALVAFEAARLSEPAVLFASARRAPSIQRAETFHLLDDDALIAETRRLSGVSAELFAEPGMRELVLPPLRADYRALAGYRPSPDAVVGAPVEVLLGDRDPRVTEEEARAWEPHTTGEFACTVFPGGDHFYLADRTDELATLITRRLARLPR
ncbi:alpha/beta fold hydrolase [Streptomyces sp. P9(2023)]|uniref:thioesterase II family protein n=1 Tax=Streptomyces sp. P9(2023) TaxID=3064394 RepID=UPI0028F3F2C6|nr:alpha/beta fold hydrolase [Streptomyces sp. P9(2023)]MDT9693391.1 alpha/beta fold hydrolase [Streptomyces sp. P9(2023)]